MPANAVWTPPADWAVNEVATAAKLNQQLRDNLAYLKGVLDGVSLQDVVLARNLTVIGSLSARPYVFDVWPDANNLTIRPPGAGYLNITSPINIELFTNAYKAGDGNWYRFDTTKGGFAVRLLADYGLGLQTFGAGTGAIIPTGILTLFPSGGVYIGSNPSDPGANNLMVQGAIHAKVAVHSWLPDSYWTHVALRDATGALRWAIDTDPGAGRNRLLFSAYQGAAGSETSVSTPLQLWRSGGVYIGSSLADPGANNLQVQQDVIVGRAISGSQLNLSQAAAQDVTVTTNRNTWLNGPSITINVPVNSRIMAVAVAHSTGADDGIMLRIAIGGSVGSESGSAVLTAAIAMHQAVGSGSITVTAQYNVPAGSGTDTYRIKLSFNPTMVRLGQRRNHDHSACR